MSVEYRRTEAHGTSPGGGEDMSPLEWIRRQRSHALLILSNPRAAHGGEFLHWYQGDFRKVIGSSPGVLSLRLYRQSDVDITMGQNPRVPFHYLGFAELSIDGAGEAEHLIEQVASLHAVQRAAEPPATWLYFPVSERVGRPARRNPSTLTLAFANGLPGAESQFREWYVTRHIRHALNIPALVNGQCFQRTIFQKPGALDASFEMIAMYDQEGTSESIIESFRSLPADALRFPTLDESRFAEAVYEPIQ